MIARLIAFFILLATLYIGSVFLLPTFSDTIGSAAWNDKIRNLKNTLESASGVINTDKPLIQNITDIAEPYIEDTKVKTQKLQQTIETKTQEVQQAADSVKQAIDAVDTAKESIKKATTFGTGS